MKTRVNFSTVKPQNPDIVFVELMPETDAEKKLLDDNKDHDVIERYYHAAIATKLPEYVLLRMHNDSLWPRASEFVVQKPQGLGSY